MGASDRAQIENLAIEQLHPVIFFKDSGPPHVNNLYILRVMGMIIGARDLRLRTAEVLRAVSEGETVLVSYRGRPVAEISPIRKSPRAQASRAEDAFGMWKDHAGLKEVNSWVRKSRRLRQDRQSSTPTS